MPSGGLQIFGSGMRLQPNTPGVVDTGNFNIGGTGIAGLFHTKNAPSASQENSYFGSTRTFGIALSQGSCSYGAFQKIGNTGGMTPQFATLMGNQATVYCDRGTAIGNAANAGIDRGNVAQASPHTAVGFSTAASQDAADFTTNANACVGSQSSAIGQRAYTFGYLVQAAGTGQSDLVLIGSRISVTGNNLLNCLVIRSGSATKNLTAAADSNSIQIGEPSQTRVLIGPYTITSGIAAVGAMQIAGVTIANTAVETTGIGTLVGSNIIPGGRLTAGSTIRIRARGIMADTGAPTLRIRIKVGANTFCDTGAVALAALAGTHGWMLEADVTVRTVGSPGTAIGNSSVAVSVINPPDLDTINTATTALDTAIANTVDLTFQWDTADPANTLTVTHYTMEILG